MKRFNFLGRSNRDVHYPMNGSNHAHVRVWAKKKLVPISSSRLEGLTSKLCHLGYHIG